MVSVTDSKSYGEEGSGCGTAFISKVSPFTAFFFLLFGNVTGLCPITEASFSSGTDLVLLHKAILRPRGSLGDVEQPTEKALALAIGDNWGEEGRGLSVSLTGDEREGMGNNRGEDWPWDCQSVLMVIGCGI